MGGAAQAYAQVLQADPTNVKALGGLAKVYLASGDTERAREVLDMAPPGAKDPGLDSVRAALTLAAEAPSETAAFEARLAKDPDDHAARFELAKALAGAHKLEKAADQLLTIIEKDRGWNDDAARKQLLTVFEAAGQMSEVARHGRRRLSAILFS
jgi:putative thioredoxin